MKNVRGMVVMSALVVAVLACNLGNAPVPGPTAVVPTSQPASTASAAQQSVNLPTTTGGCTINTSWPTYAVVAGDTLATLATRTGSTIADLASANCLIDENSLAVGQPLRVPHLPVDPLSKTGSAPLVLLLHTASLSPTDLYSWSSASRKFIQLTTWGYTYNPILGPDGRQVAYLSTSTAAVTAIKRGVIGSGFPPANIWILDISTGNGVRVADQPAGATMESGKLIQRGTPPSWSPDGQSLAWVEVDTTGERLAIYSVAQTTTRMIQLTLPPQCCEGAFRQALWDRPGIAIDSFNGTSPDNVEHVIYLFDPSGSRLSTLNLGKTGTVETYGWIADGGKDYFAAAMNATWKLIDPLSGAVSDMPGVPELYSLAAPGGVTVVRTHDPAIWQIYTGNATQVISNVDIQVHIAISPDGQQVAYQAAGKLVLYTGSGSTLIPVDADNSVKDLAWSPTAWRVRHNP